MEPPSLIGLSSMPPELFDKIFQIAGGQALLNTWKACNRELNSKLTTGITTIELWDIVPASTCRWPKCLPEFKNLTHLKIVNPRTQLLDLDQASVELLKLSPKLKSLQLDVWGSDHFFFTSSEDNHAYLHTLFLDEDFNQSSIPSEDPVLPPRPEGKLIDLSSRFPQLETLLVPCRKYFEDSHVKYLPRSLTHLQFSYDSRVTDACIPDLPPNLKYVAFGSSVKLAPAAVIQLPRSLTHIVTACFENLAYQSYHLMPPSLSELEVPRYIESNVDVTKNLPPTLTRIRLRWPSGMKIDSDTISSLPKGLTDLDIRYLHTEKVTPQTFSKLPTHLRRLVFDRFPHSFDGFTKNDMPQHLTYLSINGSKVASHQLSVLPDSLTELILLSPTEDHGNESAANLPRNLKKLQLGISKQFNDQGFQHLPRTLISLSLNGNSSITGSGFKDLPTNLIRLELPQTDNIDDKYISDLPRGLESFKAKQSVLTPACLRFLPPRLEVFNIMNHIAVQASDMQYLPSTLIDLQITLENEALISLLPQQLRILHLLAHEAPATASECSDSIKKFTSKMFGDLPRKLRILTVNDPIEVRDEEVKNLPRRLISISLPNVTGITKNCVIDLPEDLDWTSILPKPILKEHQAMRSRRQNSPFEAVDPRVLKRFENAWS